MALATIAIAISQFNLFTYLQGTLQPRSDQCLQAAIVVEVVEVNVQRG
jgi:hypothetical protein